MIRKLNAVGLFVIALTASVGTPASAARDLPSIAELATAVNEETGEFSILLAALDEAGLVETLDGNRQFTVFAPIDVAFGDLGYDSESIREVPVDALTDILLYHVSPGRRLSGDILSSDNVRMINKQFTFPSISDDLAFINDAMLLAPDLIDLEASNGVVHVIDAVLLPPAEPEAAAVAAVPEPATAGLVLASLLGLSLLRARSSR